MTETARLAAFVVVLGAVVGTTAQARAEEGATWRAFSPKNGGFTVLLPGSPQESRQTFETAAGPVDASLYVLELDGGAVVYLVAVSEFSKEAVASVKSEAVLDGARDGAVKNVKGRLASEKRITLAGHHGREIAIEAPGDFAVLVRIYLVKARLFQVLAVMPRSKLQSGDAARFLDSFRLGGS